MRSSRRAATSLRSSRRTTAKEVAVKPCLRAFWEERSLPSGVVGPVGPRGHPGGIGAIGGELVWGNGMRHGNSTLRSEDGMGRGLSLKLAGFPQTDVVVRPF